MLSPSSGSTVIKSKLIGRRMFLLTAAKAIVTFGIIGRLVSLQINERTKYKTLSDKNRFREWKLAPERGVIRDFFDKGGDVLYSILFLSIWLSWLILDRYFYFLRQHSDRVEDAMRAWQHRSETSSWFALVERRSLISKVEIEMSRGLKLIPSIIA